MVGLSSLQNAAFGPGSRMLRKVRTNPEHRAGTPIIYCSECYLVLAQALGPLSAIFELPFSIVGLQIGLFLHFHCRQLTLCSAQLVVYQKLHRLPVSRHCNSHHADHFSFVLIRFFHCVRPCFLDRHARRPRIALIWRLRPV